MPVQGLPGGQPQEIFGQQKVQAQGMAFSPSPPTNNTYSTVFKY